MFYSAKETFLSFRFAKFPLLGSDVHLISSYGVYISQLVRFARICHNVSDVNKATMFIG